MIKTTVKIEGMSCGMCEAHICNAIRKAIPEAKKVGASHKKDEADFLTEAEVDSEELKKIIDDTGYRFISISSEPYEKRRFSFGKR